MSKPNKFKPGDRVRCVVDEKWGVYRASPGDILIVRDGGLDDFIDELGGVWWNSNFVLVTPATPSTPPVPAEDPIIAAVCADLQARSQVGIRKYGVTLARPDMTHAQWLQHAYEECLDQANYLKAAILTVGASA